MKRLNDIERKRLERLRVAVARLPAADLSIAGQRKRGRRLCRGVK